MRPRGVQSELVGRVAGLPEASVRLIDLAELVIADAELDVDPARRAEVETMAAERGMVVTDPDGELSKIRHLFTSDWADEWWEATAALMAVRNGWFELADMASGPLHRRIDAIYDRFDTPFCAHEVQSFYGDMVEGLVEASTSGRTKMLRLAAQFGVGAAGGFATASGVPAMPIAMKAVDWIERQGRELTSLTYELAAVLTVWNLLPAREGGLTSAEDAMLSNFQREARAVVSDSAVSPAVERMWRSVMEMMGSGPQLAVALPELCKMSLERARTVAGAYGLMLDVVDGCRAGNDSRVPWSEKNWRVVAQYPASGTPAEKPVVAVAVTKFDEPSAPGLSVLLRSRFDANV